MEKNPIYAIHGVKQNPDNLDDVIQVPDEEAQFFAIFFNDQVVGDYPSREAAEAELNRYAEQRVYGDQDSDPNGKELPPLPVENLDQFAQLMVDWHTDAQKQIALASNPPKDVRILATINGKERTLRDTERQAFIAGVQVAGEIFKTLPFQFVEQETQQAVEGDSDA